MKCPAPVYRRNKKNVKLRYSKAEIVYFKMEKVQIYIFFFSFYFLDLRMARATGLAVGAA
jgi:hypothetical protein